jgi:cell division inhibitor SulA
LPAGGWPLQSVVELVVDDWGSGELQLLLPLMRDLSGQGSRLAMIGPPYLPYALALEDAGIDLDCLVVIDNQVSNDNRWWCAEKLLHHDQCRLVLVWPQYSRADQVRRLLLAAAAGNSLGVIFSRDNPVDTPVSLRLKAEYCGQGIFVEVLKSRFSWLRGSAVIPDHDFPGMISWP